MIIKFFLLAFLIYEIFSLQNSNFKLITSSINLQSKFFKHNDEYLNPAIEHFKSILKQSLLKSSNITLQCREALQYSFLNEDNPMQNFNYLKIIRDSSKNENDVGSYSDCLNSKYYLHLSDEVLQNFTYVVVNIDVNDGKDKTDIKYEKGNYIFGVCWIKKCSGRDYEELFFYLNDVLGNPLKLESLENVSIFTYEEEQNKKWSLAELLLGLLIPSYILTIQLIFVIFNRIPEFLFKNCFRKVRTSIYANISRIGTRVSTEEQAKMESINSSPNFNNNGNMDINIKRLDKNRLYEFKSAFCFNQNGEELFSIKSRFYNDSGLSYIKGIMGISMIILPIGFVYFNIYTSPVKAYSPQCYVELISGFYYGLIFFGLRYSPRILLSCSGYSLVYKLMCYLDDFISNIHSSSSLSWQTLRVDGVGRSMLETELYNNSNFSCYNHKIPYRILFKFFFSQIYKYILFILIILFVRFSVFFYLDNIFDIGPIWYYFKNEVKKQWGLFDMFSQILLFDMFTGEERFHPFWLLTNEFIFFIISSFLIFLSYKKNFRLDFCYWILFICLIIFRLIYFYTNKGRFYSTLYDYKEDYGYFEINPLYNFSYHLIGICFGKINYVIQKGLSRKEAIKSNKKYLLISVVFSKLYKKGRKNIFTISIVIGVLIIILFSLSTPLFAIFYDIKNNNENLSLIYKNKFLNFLYLIDIEIVVIIIHLIGMAAYVMGENQLFKFLSNSIWVVFGKFYFSYILLLYLAIIYVINTSEYRIKVEYFNLLFFNVISFIVLLVWSILVYLIYELPFKRLSKIIFKEQGIDVELNSNPKNNIFNNQ